MGGRGAFNPNYGRTGGIPLDQRIYSCIGYLEHIKIIQCDKISNNPTTTFSNTANTTYYSYSKENHRIEHIYYFKNHKLVKSVDFNEGAKPHAHYWNNGIPGRKRHDKHNIHELSARDTRLLNAALEYNRRNHQNEH